jgi:hypothetical protein
VTGCTRDAATAAHDLVASTEGRGLWILDDITPLHELSDSLIAAATHLVKPRRAYRIMGGGGGGDPTPNQGKNAPTGAVIRYWVGAPIDSAQVLSLDILDGGGTVVRSYSSVRSPTGRGRGGSLATGRGMNQIVWDLRTNGLAPPGGMSEAGGRGGGARSGYVVASGAYTVGAQRFAGADADSTHWDASRALRELQAKIGIGRSASVSRRA